VKPQCRRILADLSDHEWHSAAEWLNAHPPIVAFSQRVTDLKRLGYGIESTGPGGHDLARYRLTSEPVPTVDDHDGALFEVAS
jgi:hypothetical protein